MDAVRPRWPLCSAALGRPSGRALRWGRVGLFAGALLGAAPAAAQEVSLQITDPRVNEASLTANLVDLVGQDLRLSDDQTFPAQMGEAAALSTKGMGVDYASNPQHVVFGGSLGTAVNGAGFTFGRGPDPLPAGGFAFALSAMVGVNLGAAADDDSPARRFVLYGNGMAGSNARAPFGADYMNLGAHLQVMLVKRVDAGAAEWGGIALTTGYERSRYALELNDELDLEGNGVGWAATGSYRVETTDNTVPIELSTNMRLAFFTLFGGAALDLRPAATVVSTVSLSGSIEAAVGGKRSPVGTAVVTDDFTIEGTAQTFRFFVGPQFNLGPVKVYGHLNIAPGGGVGGHTGLRLAL